MKEIFGEFGLDPEKDIFFEHTIVGSTCDKEELRASIMASVMNSDDYDDKIEAKWGGQTARSLSQVGMNSSGHPISK